MNRYLFHLDQSSPQYSIKICVKECPTEQLDNIAEIYSFYTRTGSSLCRYDFNFTSSQNEKIPDLSRQFYNNDQQMSRFSSTGPCPVNTIFPTLVLFHLNYLILLILIVLMLNIILMITNRKAILYRCIPELAVRQV
jgi:hypothetical protein